MVDSLSIHSFALFQVVTVAGTTRKSCYPAELLRARQIASFGKVDANLVKGEVNARGPFDGKCSRSPA